VQECPKFIFDKALLLEIHMRKGDSTTCCCALRMGFREEDEFQKGGSNQTLMPKQALAQHSKS